MYFMDFLLVTFVYLLYIQFSPGMGNVWYRNNEYFSFIGAWKVIVFPLENIDMWHYTLWDINYFIWVMFYILLTFLHHYYQNILL